MRESAQPTLLGINLSRLKIASPSCISDTEPESHEMPIQLSWSESIGIALDATAKAAIATVQQIRHTYAGIAAIAEIQEKFSDDPKYKVAVNASTTTIAIALFNSIENYKRKKKDYITRKLNK